MVAGYTRPPTPAAVERQLRQEAGFGCARCGHPFIEFHHIVPFSEEKHFRASDMVALCGNCHKVVAKQGRDRQYEIKANPFNISRGLFKGALEYDKRDLVFRVGGNWYENTPVILQFDDRPIVSCAIVDRQVRVSLDLINENGRSALKIVENDIDFRLGDVWDFQYAHNFISVRYRRGNIALKIDLRKPDATIEGELWFRGQKIRLRSEETILPRHNVVRNCRFSGARVGILLN